MKMAIRGSRNATGKDSRSARAAAGRAIPRRSTGTPIQRTFWKTDRSRKTKPSWPRLTRSPTRRSARNRPGKRAAVAPTAPPWRRAEFQKRITSLIPSTRPATAPDPDRARSGTLEILRGSDARSYPRRISRVPLRARSGSGAVAGRVLGISDVIRFWNSARRHGGAVGATAARFPGRFLALRRVGDLVSRGHEGFVFRERSVFQNVLWIGVPVDLLGIALPAAARADLLSFPVAFREPRIAIFIVMCRVVEEIFVGADGEPVHDRGDAGNSPGHNDRLVRLLLRVYRAGELDDAVFDGADVDRALAQRRIVLESLEHSLL